jgi:glucokinase
MNSQAPPASRPWLVADIGGTNVRFGLATDARSPVQDIDAMRCANFTGPAEAARRYLDSVAARRGALYVPPQYAAFAVATAVDGDRVELTNSAWSFTRSKVQSELGVERLLVVNDFEALALSLPHLRGDQLRAHGALPSCDATVAVIGPGTGLGVGGLLHTPQGRYPIPGEGGHSTLAAADDFEAAVLANVRREYDHVSAERVLSGIGLPVLHAAVAAALGRAATPLATPQIVQMGSEGTDELAVQTLETFCAMLGTFAGNVCLITGARGGLYIGGGIVPRFADAFFRSRFRERFEAKGRFRPYLQAIPTALIVEPHAALTGAAAAIEASLSGREVSGHAA